MPGWPPRQASSSRRRSVARDADTDRGDRGVEQVLSTSMSLPLDCKSGKKLFGGCGPRPVWLGKHTELTPPRAPRRTPGRKSTQTGQTPTRYPPGACAGRKEPNFVLGQVSHPNPGSTCRDHPASFLAGPRALLVPLKLKPHVHPQVPYCAAALARAHVVLVPAWEKARHPRSAIYAYPPPPCNYK